MKNPERDKHQRDADHYLDNVQGRYAFDPTSGLYKQQPPETEQEGHSTVNGGLPFIVDVKRDWVVLALSAATLILIGATVYYTHKQWKTMNDTLGEITQQTTAAQQSADAADRSSLTSQRAEREAERSGDWQAKQSSAALQATIENFNREQRAWVVFQSESTEITADRRKFFKLRFTNTGRTPAFGVDAITFISGSLNSIPDHDPPASDPESGLIGPEGTFLTDSILLSTRDSSFIPSGQNVFVYGTIWYRDVAKQRHWTQFCFRTSGDATYFEPCTKHSSTDDEEKKR